MTHCHSRGEEKTLTLPNLGDIFIIDAELDTTSIFDSHCVLSFCFSSLQFPCYFSISMIYLNRLNFYMHISLFIYSAFIVYIYTYTYIYREFIFSFVYSKNLYWICIFLLCLQIVKFCLNFFLLYLTNHVNQDVM